MSDRINKAADQWTEDELVTWAKDDVKTGSKVSDGSVAKEIVKRYGLEDGPVTVVKEQFLNEVGSEPVTEEEGEDTDEPTSEPTVSETGAQEEVEDPNTLPEASVPPVAEEGTRVVNDETIKPEATAPEEPPKDPTRVIFEDQLNRYLEAMAPGKPINDQKGASLQAVLWRTIQLVLNRPGSEFTSYYGDLLATVHKHRDTVFHERYLFRFWDSVSMAPAERRNFERILNLMINTADPAKRAHAMKQVDLDATLKGFNDTDVHQKLTEFYSTI